MERKRVAEATKGVGKPNVGGPFDLIDHDGRRFTQEDLKGKYALVCSTLFPLASLIRLFVHLALPHITKLLIVSIFGPLMYLYFPIGLLSVHSSFSPPLTHLSLDPLIRLLSKLDYFFPPSFLRLSTIIHLFI